MPEHRVVFRRKGEVGEHRFKKTKVGGLVGWGSQEEVARSKWFIRSSAFIAGRTVNSSSVFTEEKTDMHVAKCFVQVSLSNGI